MPPPTRPRGLRRSHSAPTARRAAVSKDGSPVSRESAPNSTRNVPAAAEHVSLVSPEIGRTKRGATSGRGCVSAARNNYSLFETMYSDTCSVHENSTSTINTKYTHVGADLCLWAHYLNVPSVFYTSPAAVSCGESGVRLFLMSGVVNPFRESSPLQLVVRTWPGSKCLRRSEMLPRADTGAEVLTRLERRSVLGQIFGPLQNLNPT